MKKAISFLVIAFVIFGLGSASFAATPSVGAVVSDVLVLRPLGFAGTVLGSAAFVVSLPVTLATHKVDRAERILVQRPYEYTFERPLGQV